MIVVDIFIKSRLSPTTAANYTPLYMAVMFVGFWFWLPSSSSIQCQLYALYCYKSAQMALNLYIDNKEHLLEEQRNSKLHSICQSCVSKIHFSLENLFDKRCF